MRDVGMDQCVADEGPDLRSDAAGHAAFQQHRGVVARRNEREQQQKLKILVEAQDEGAHGVDAGEDRQHREDYRRNIEDRLG